MPAVSAIRTAIKDTVADNVEGIEGHEKIRDVVNVPAFVVAPAETDFAKAMGRGLDLWNFDVIVLVSRAEMDSAQDLLDEYVGGFGVKSIRQAIFQHPTLGLANLHAYVSGMSGYGATYNVGQVDYLGARLRVVVNTSGTE